MVTYLVQYDLNLFSDFTYFLNQTTGDEINQRDSRVYVGTRAEHTVYGKILGRDMENTFGFKVRQDWIGLTLDNVQNRALISHVRTDHVSQLNIAPWYQNKTQWLNWFRSVEGVRGDIFYFNSTSDLPVDSGNGYTGTLNPKLSLVFGPWSKTEFYIDGGFGFHTNDARGIFSSIDPGAGEPSRQLPALVHTRGTEVGVRTTDVPHLNSTLSVWSLWSDSDTFFDGDKGSVVDADRPGVRYGVEFSNLVTPTSWLSFDVNLAYSYAYFTDGDPQSVGILIPESVTTVASAGVSVKNIPGFKNFFGSLRLREFGPRPLIEDGSQTSRPSTIFNLASGYLISKTWSLNVEVLNLLNTSYNDNEYYYSSRLKGEAAGPDDGGGYNDHMVHTGEPRSLRATLLARF